MNGKEIRWQITGMISAYVLKANSEYIEKVIEQFLKQAEVPEFE